MPILANTLLEKIEVDHDRYCDLLQNVPVVKLIHGDADTYAAYEVVDTGVPGLEECKLLLVADSCEVVYACYYKLSDHPVFGQRVVQVEVRSDVPGLARLVMQQYFLHRYSAIRTDISNTHAGRRMWERFIAAGIYNFYVADLPILASTEEGLHNQNANNVETFLNLRRLTSDDVIWHDNRRGNVSVVYATNASIL